MHALITLAIITVGGSAAMAGLLLYAQAEMYRAEFENQRSIVESFARTTRGKVDPAYTCRLRNRR